MKTGLERQVTLENRGSKKVSLYIIPDTYFYEGKIITSQNPTKLKRTILNFE